MKPIHEIKCAISQARGEADLMEAAGEERAAFTVRGACDWILELAEEVMSWRRNAEASESRAQSLEKEVTRLRGLLDRSFSHLGNAISGNQSPSGRDVIRDLITDIRNYFQNPKRYGGPS